MVLLYMPAGPVEVTEDWLCDTLSAHPEFQHDPIQSVRNRQLGEGMGQLSTLVLGNVQCRSGRTSQVVVKLHAAVPEMHDIALRYGHYETEVNFYNKLSHDVPMRTPKIYVSAMDTTQNRVLIIMESFADWHSPDQINGADRNETTTATQQLAGLTGRYWNLPIQSDHHWLRDLKSAAYRSLPEDYRICTGITLDRIGDGMPVSSGTAAEKIGAKFRAVMDDQCSGPQALSHWDYRVENMFFGPDNQFAVIDWQLMMVTNPATDLAYLLSSNVDISLRRSVERELMEIFLDGLKKSGVKNYELNDLVADYRRALLAISAIPIIGGSGFDMGNTRSRALFTAVASRIFQAIEDWDALSVIPAS